MQTDYYFRGEELMLTDDSGETWVASGLTTKAVGRNESGIRSRKYDSGEQCLRRRKRNVCSILGRDPDASCLKR